MTGRQNPERINKIPDSVIRRTDAKPFAEFLQHVNSAPPVRRVHHQAHCAFAVEDSPESCESGVRIRKMMKNTSTDDLIEGLLQLAQTIYGQLVDLKVRQV